MLNIQTTIHSDKEGNYKAKDIISQLLKANLGIALSININRYVLRI